MERWNEERSDLGNVCSDELKWMMMMRITSDDGLNDD